MNIRTILITVCLAFSMMACTSTSYRESSGEFLDSSLITAKVKTLLIDSRITNGFRIRVNTFKGTVYLSGIVDSEEEKNEAARLVRSVDGVKAVQNDLVVRADDRA